MERRFRNQAGRDRMTAAARAQRKQPTRAESFLWDHLRGRGFRDLKFRRQHVIGRFIVDFYCAERRLVVEVDGAVHDDEEQRLRDTDRDEFLAGLGLTVLRLPATLVETDIQGALAAIATTL